MHLKRKLILSAVILSLFIPCVVSAAINVDGHLDEPEWADAQGFNKFVVIDPMTLATPPYATDARVAATKEGLAVAIICDQPSTISRTHTFTSRDAQ